jgi:uncharacterized protein (TIGR02996 family)
MPRYEYSEGTSNKFWEIERDGSVVTTRWGRIGTDGQSKEKDLGSEDKAEKEYTKLIGQKTKKGYQLVSGSDEPVKPAPKAAVKKTAAPAAPAAPVEIEPGWARYEYSEGTSNKFWEVRREGSEVTTRYGRIGSEGKSTVKELDGSAEARAEMKKLINQKTKKGYQFIGRGGVPTGARNPELEAEIVKDPDNADAFAVYGDWLQAQGDPRGELVTIQLGLQKDPEDKKLRAAEEKLFQENAAHFFGLPHPTEGDDNRRPVRYKGDDWQRSDWPKDGWAFGYMTTEWKNGFVSRLYFDPGYYYDGPGDELGSADAGELLGEILEHPSMRFVREIHCADIWADYDMGEGPELGEAVSAITDAPCTEVLEVIDFCGGDHDISGVSFDMEPRLFERCRRLRVLEIYGGQLSLCKIDMPEGRELSVFTGGLGREDLKHIVKANAPKLEKLDLMFGSDEYGADCTVDDLQPLLTGKQFPALKKLGLKNAEFTDGLCAVLPSSKILGRLEELDLSMGTMSDDGAQHLVENAEAFSHLKKINLEDNYINKPLQEQLKSALPNVYIGDQEEDSDPDDRYVQVGE